MLPLSAKDHKLINQVPEYIYEGINALLAETTAPIYIDTSKVEHIIRKLNPGFNEYVTIEKFLPEVVKDYESAGWKVTRESPNAMVFYY